MMKVFIIYNKDGFPDVSEYWDIKDIWDVESKMHKLDLKLSDIISITVAKETGS